jgi:hypothetical protein
VKSYTTAGFRDNFKELSKQIYRSRPVKRFGTFRQIPIIPVSDSRKFIRPDRFILRVSEKDIEPWELFEGDEIVWFWDWTSQRIRTSNKRDV